MRVCGTPVALLLLIVVLAACGERAAAPAPARPVEIRVSENVDGKSTGLEVGQVLRVDLPAEPDAGRFWTLVSVDADVLAPEGVEELALVWDGPGHEEATATSIWRFEAVAPGLATLRLRYAPLPTGPDEPAALRTFTLRVAVGPRR